MTAIQGSNQSLVRVTNQNLIVQELLSSSQLSRTQLAKRLRLSNPSISKNVDDLKRRGMLIEVGAVETELGRRPVMLEFNKDRGRIAAVDLGTSHVIVAITDLSGKITSTVRLEWNGCIDYKLLLKVADFIEQLCHEPANRGYDLLAIAIASPGRVDADTGNYILAKRIADYQNLNAKKLFENRFKVPTLLKNDVALAVIGEHTYGAGRNCDDLLYILSDKGIGAGILLNGKPYEGSGGFSGELGMTLFDGERAINRWNNKKRPKTLEEHASIAIAVIRAKDLAPLNPESVLNNAPITFDTIIQGVEAQDSVCLQVLEESALNLAYALSNVTYLLDIKKIIIGGSIRRFGFRYLETVRNFLRDVVINPQLTVEWSELGDQAAMLGAASYAISYTINRLIQEDLEIHSQAAVVN